MADGFLRTRSGPRKLARSGRGLIVRPGGGGNVVFADFTNGNPEFYIGQKGLRGGPARYALPSTGTDPGIAEVGANVARYPLTSVFGTGAEQWTEGGFLSEQPFTNLVQSSENIIDSDANWTAVGNDGFDSTSGTTPLAGSNDASVVFASATEERGYIQTVASAAALLTGVSVGIFAAVSNGNANEWVCIRYTNSDGAVSRGWFNPVTGAVGTTDGGASLPRMEQSRAAGGLSPYWWFGFTVDNGTIGGNPTVEYLVCSGNGVTTANTSGGNNTLMWGALVAHLPYLPQYPQAAGNLPGSDTFDAVADPTGLPMLDFPEGTTGGAFMVDFTPLASLQAIMKHSSDVGGAPGGFLNSTVSAAMARTGGNPTQWRLRVSDGTEFGTMNVTVPIPTNVLAFVRTRWVWNFTGPAGDGMVRVYQGGTEVASAAAAFGVVWGNHLQIMSDISGTAQEGGYINHQAGIWGNPTGLTVAEAEALSVIP